MNVILKKAIVDLGRYGDTIKVARGYARNYLIPKGIAVEATPGNLNQFNAEKSAYMKKEEHRVEAARKLSEGLSAVELAFQRKAGEEDRLFGSVTSHDVEKALKEKGYEVERSWIMLPEPIKKLGSYTVEIRLHHEVAAQIKVEVEKE